MNPELVKELQQMPQIREFVDFLRAQLADLDTVSDIAGSNMYDVAIEAVGRKRACETIRTILAPLLDTVSDIPNSDNDYSVNVV